MPSALAVVAASMFHTLSPTTDAVPMARPRTVSIKRNLARIKGLLLVQLLLLVLVLIRLFAR